MSAQSYNLIPQPVEVIPAQGEFLLNLSTTIVAGKTCQTEALYLQAKLRHSTGMPFKLVSSSPSGNAMELKINPARGLPAEGYTIAVDDKRIVIEGKDAAGVFYGVQTLLQLLPPQVYASQLQSGVQWAIPAVSVKDYPRFPYRGMMLDVVRQFFDEETVKNYIDWLAMHKINKFHWHLTDDQGWRIEIKKYPKLTSVAAWRGPNEAIAPTLGSGDQRYGGFYTQKQIKEIIRYAADRHIEIIPELDLPGHSHAAASAYPEILCPTSREPRAKRAPDDQADVWCVGNEANFTMLANILKEVAALFPSKIIHIGGDEVNMAIWPRCPVCSDFMKKENLTSPEELQNYFVHRLGEIVHHLGKRMAGWDEILDGGDLDPSTQVYAWRSLKRAQESVKKELPTVVMVAQHYYFDMAQSRYDRGHNWAGILPLEKAYALDPCDGAFFTPEQTKLVQGVQGGIWAELLNEPAHFLEYQSYPRICALAETGWTQQSLRDWNGFYRRLTASHFDRMYNMGIAFRVPTPVALYKDGAVTVIPPYEGADVRFTTDGSEPVASSPKYISLVRESDYENFKCKTIFKDRSSIVMPVECVSPGTWSADTTSKPQVQEWNLSGIVDRPGVWYASFLPPLVTNSAAKVSQVRLCEDGVAIAFVERMSSTDLTLRYRLPLFAFDASKKYTLRALVQGKDTLSGKVHVERSPYQEPPVGISTNLNLRRENASLLTDYDFSSAVSTADPGSAGQYLTFVFATPVVCSSIKAITGYTFTRLAYLKSGHLEFSYDGKTWQTGDKFVKGEAQIHPSQPVKAVKIVVDGPNDDPNIVFQDLRIE